MQTTLEQIRATNALEAANSVKKNAVSRLPAMILGNGLLSTSAFARDKGEGLRDAMDALAIHLQKTGRISPTPKHLETEGHTANDDILNDLKGRDSTFLRLATIEALAYISFLKRFARD